MTSREDDYNELKELLLLNGADIEIVEEHFNEIYTLETGVEYPWSQLISSNTELSRTPNAEKEKILSILVRLNSQKKTEKAEKKKKNGDKIHTTIEELESRERDNGIRRISNYVLYKTIKDEHPEEDVVEVWLEDGEIRKEIVGQRIIPNQTAPTPDFTSADNTSLKDVFIEMRALISDYGAFQEESMDPDLIVLGSMASYFYECFTHLPYYDYTSAEPGVGKTTAMMTQAFMGFNGTVNSSITEAVIFRELEQTHGFYAIDNTEHLFTAPEKNSGICDVLLSSHTKSTYVPRMEHDADGNMILRKFDCFGIKAFTHIRDIPLFLKPLRERSVQIVMQEGTPKKFHPQPEDFVEIRDRMYLRRLYDSEAVKNMYDTLVSKNGLPGRAGDLFYSLLAIAKLIDISLYNRVLEYAIGTEFIRKERDPRIGALIRVIWEGERFGSQNSNILRELWEEQLRADETLGQYPPTTRSTTAMLRKLGFFEEDKKTDGKKWFVFDKAVFAQRAFEYGVISKDDCLKYQNAADSSSATQTEIGDDSTDHLDSDLNESNVSEDLIYSREDQDKNISKDNSITENTLKGERDSNDTLLVRNDSVEMGICERCGKRRYLTHIWSDREGKQLVCGDCTEDLFDILKSSSSVAKLPAIKSHGSDTNGKEGMCEKEINK